MSDVLNSRTDKAVDRIENSIADVKSLISVLETKLVKYSFPVTEELGNESKECVKEVKSEFVEKLEELNYDIFRISDRVRSLIDRLDI